MSPPTTPFRTLSIGIIGGGIGGLSAGIALRRAGHTVTIYERADYAGEVGASISCAANGMKWLCEWGVDIASGDPVELLQLINRDWETGEVVSKVDLKGYESEWGFKYNMFHRQYMHRMLMDCALDANGAGTPVKILVNHKCTSLDPATGTVTFEDHPTSYKHDLLIGADGVGSTVRTLIGIEPTRRPSDSSCLHANVHTSQAKSLGLHDFSLDNAIEYWGGHHSHNKIVLSPCNAGSLLSYYCFFPRSAGDYSRQNWSEKASLEELLSPYPDLDPAVRRHLEIGEDVRPWRLWVHEPYEWWVQGVTCVMGDAAHPMMPDQSQGACMAIEDAGCLGVVFGREFFDGDVKAALKVYERVRMPRATRVQDAALRARENIHERIGFSDNTKDERYDVQDEGNKLTIEEMNAYDMREDIRKKLAATTKETT